MSVSVNCAWICDGFCRIKRALPDYDDCSSREKPAGCWYISHSTFAHSVLEHLRIG